MRNHLKKALLIIGHGSKLKGFDAAMKKVARDVRKNGRFGRVECAYLEITSPSIEEGIASLVRKGAREIRVLPYFLLLGRHIRQDIPAIIRKARRIHRGRVRVLLCPYLGYDASLARLVQKRASGA